MATNFSIKMSEIIRRLGIPKWNGTSQV